MEGASSVLFAREGLDDRLWQALQSYLDAIAADPDLLYADQHGTKHPGKFVLVEMYRDGAARARQATSRHGLDWAAARCDLLEPESTEERIRPLMSAPPAMARPADGGAASPPQPLRRVLRAGCQPCGAFVRVFPKPEYQAEFMPILHAQGERIAAGEPGFLYADFYLFDDPGCWLVVEYYDDRGSLSHHHTLAHTFDFADRKARAGYESRKHDAFTLRPLASVGPWARSFPAAGGS
ncbi:MAG: antibiotic biosynthesis monooxygenase [Gammaproteobacteria bacterium]|nr:antibiotic biosynthesis monooxygenase [Gammaproteobacteria bacterium]